MDFKTFKKGSKNSIDNLVKELDRMKSGGNKFIDERFWKIPTDEKTGNGTALIRLLPECAENKLPWVTLFSHSFKGPGGWYIENSLSTIGKPDPVGDMNHQLWITEIEANKNLVRKRARKTRYISNILVLSDSKNPENEGKVFAFGYGKQIFQKIQDLMFPEFENETRVDPFDFWAGANLRLKVKKVDGYPKYDSSFFESPSALLGGDDAELEKIWKMQYDLSEFVSEKNFKTYEELQERLNKVLGNVKAETPKAAKPTKPAKPVVSKPAANEDDTPWGGEDDDDNPASTKVTETEEDDLSDFLKKLAGDD